MWLVKKFALWQFPNVQLILAGSLEDWPEYCSQANCWKSVLGVLQLLYCFTLLQHRIQILLIIHAIRLVY